MPLFFIFKIEHYGKRQTITRPAADNGGLLAEPVGGAGGAEGLSVPVNREAADSELCSPEHQRSARSLRAKPRISRITRINRAADACMVPAAHSINS